MTLSQDDFNEEAIAILAYETYERYLLNAFGKSEKILDFSLIPETVRNGWRAVSHQMCVGLQKQRSGETSP